VSTDESELWQIAEATYLSSTTSLELEPSPLDNCTTCCHVLLLSKKRGARAAGSHLPMLSSTFSAWIGSAFGGVVWARCKRFLGPGRLFGPEWLILSDLVIQRQVDVHSVFLDSAVRNLGTEEVCVRT